MISDKDARARGWWFNYSVAQWSAISEQVNKIGSGSGRPFSYLELLGAANVYLDENFCSPQERAADFENIAQLAQHLRLTVASSFAVDHEETDPLPDEWLDAVERIELWARANASLFRLGRSAKDHFYMTVLECWGDAGGSFRRSRTSPTGQFRGGEASGPTVLYVEAAVKPVMGERAPGREAIYKLIARYKKHDDEMQREMESTLAKAEGARRPNAAQKALLVLARKEGRSRDTVRS